MKFSHIFKKPYYIFRPKQIFVRLWRNFLSPSGPLTEVILPWGLRINVNINENVGHAVWTTGVHELVVSEALWRLIKEGDTAVDAGANIGYMTGIMAIRCGTSGGIFAFEPHPQVYEVLQQNVVLFKKDQKISPIQTANVALSDRAGQSILTFTESEFKTNWGIAQLTDDGKKTGYQVQTTTLDRELGGKRVAVLKIDVEGHELSVLEGAKGLLREGRIENIVYENNDIKNHAVQDFLIEMGYTVYYLSWKIGGILLIPINKDFTHRPSETANYLATASPEKVVQIFSRRGWDILQQRN